MYKALDVREHVKFGKAQWFHGYGGKGGEISVPQTLHVVVIAEETETHQRVRFDFIPAYKFKFGDKTHYGGFTGRYDMIVPGDYFNLRETETHVEVVLINVL